LRFDADDLGRPGAGGGGAKPDPDGIAGELGEDWLCGGTRFERTRKVDLLGGDVLKSIAEADRAVGGAGPEFEDEVRPGEAV